MRNILKMNEMIKNKDLLRSLTRELIQEFLKIYKLQDYNFRKEYKGTNMTYEFIGIPILKFKKVMTLFDKYKGIMLENDYIMSYRYSKKPIYRYDKDVMPYHKPGNGYELNFYVFVKDLHTEIVIPNKIVYHYSPQSKRQYILNNGLIPMSSDKSKQWNKEEYEYPPLIFAVNDEELGWHHHKDEDKWAIDTENLPNKWWYDLNTTNIVNSKSIMTFDPVPVQYIKLVKSTNY